MNRSENSNYTWNEYAAPAYDATWAIALMLHESVEVMREWVFPDGTRRRLEDFTYGDSEMTQIFLHLLSKTDFIGVSVRIRFSKLVRNNHSFFWKHNETFIVCTTHISGGNALNKN